MQDSIATRSHMMSKWTHKEIKEHTKALHEILTTVTNPHKQLGNECSLSESDPDCTACPLHNTQALFTETDVTLPSFLNGSLWSSSETEPVAVVTKCKRGRCQNFSYHSSSAVLDNVFQEMMTIYEQLKAKRLGLQQWEMELQEIEGRLEQRGKALGRLSSLEEEVHARILAVEQKHQVEVEKLQNLLRDKNKEIRRHRCSFDTIKELNDSMKKQLNEVGEQNKKLESQSKRVQARLDNLQRKYEHNMALRDRQTVCIKSAATSQSKPERTAVSGKRVSKVSLSPTPPNLLAHLLDWLLDGQPFSTMSGDKMMVPDQCLPPEVLLNERCIKVLPVLADQLHQTPSSEPLLLLNLLRFIYWTLRHLDNSTQHVALSTTLRRIGEEVSKPTAQSPLSPTKPPDGLPASHAGAARSSPLYRSPCPHTRVLSTLICLRTVTQADVLAQALESLHSELMREESRGLFLHYDGVCVLLSLLRAGRSGLHTSIDILMQLTAQSSAFLEACSCEEFFRTVSLLLKSPRLELPSLEKLSILLQKLSTLRKNRRLFDLSSLQELLQQLHRSTNPTHTFLCLNLSSILLNLR